MTKQKSVFISRNLTSESEFLQQLTEAGFQVHGESLLTFTAVPFTSIPKVDWLFFYSKNGVTYFFKQLQEKNISLSDKIKFAAFGPGTAEAIRSNGVITSFIGSGKKVSTAEAFGSTAKNAKVLFVRAKNSQKSIQQLIKTDVVSKDLVVYNNISKQDIHISPHRILVFTSPLNAQTYFAKYSLDTNQRVLAIGETTAKALKKLDIKSEIAAFPNEKGLLKLIFK